MQRIVEERAPMEDISAAMTALFSAHADGRAQGEVMEV